MSEEVKIKPITIFYTVLVIAFLIWIYWPGEETFTDDYSYDNIAQKPENRLEDNFVNISELHWGHMPLTYRISHDCIERQRNLTELAFEKISLETSFIVNFEETSENPDIEIKCESQGNGGEDAIADAIPYTDYYSENLIDYADINIYGQGAVCLTGYPALEVHEILHTFGFIHNPLVDSVMHPYSSEYSRKCEITKIDDEYISCLRYIYSNGEIGECSIKNYVKEATYDLECNEGWYEVEGTDYCCPEPNMEIIDGYCF